MKKLNKVICLILSIIMVLTLIPTTLTQNIYAATKATASNEITKINLSNPPIMDANYEFVIQPTKNSEIIWDSGDLDSINKKGSYKKSTLYEYNGKIYDEIQYNWYTKDDSLGDGDLGFTVTNVGTYKGKELDLHCTYYWDAESTGGTQIYQQAYICVSRELGYVEFGFVIHSYTIKFDIYEHGTKTLVPINCNLTFNDVDYQQLFGFKMNNGSINAIQCASNSRVYYHNDGSYKWFFAENIGDSNSPLDAIRLELKNVSSYYIKFGSGHDKGCSGNYYSSEFADKWNSANVQATNEGGYDPYFWSAAGLLAFTFGAYAFKAPEKYVSDTDETLVTTNTLGEKEKFTYEIHQAIPAEVETGYYSAYVLKDILPSCLTYNSITIIDKNGTNVTNKFTTSTNGQTITISAKDTKASTFYSNNYKFKITVTLKDNVVSSTFKNANNHYRFTNQATATFTRGGSSKDENTNIVTSNYYTTTLNIKKIWKDNGGNYNTRKNIKVDVLRDGTVLTTKTISASNAIDNNTWQLEVELPKYNAKKQTFAYTLSEQNIGTITANTEDWEITTTTSESYVPTINGNEITNTLTGKVSINGTKIWKDNNNNYKTRPTTYTLILYRNGAVFEEKTFNVTSYNFSTNTFVNNTDTWSFTNLNKYDANGKKYNYTVGEKTCNVNTATSKATEHDDTYVATCNGATITNTLTGYKSLTIIKYWNDWDNIFHTREDIGTLYMHVYRNIVGDAKNGEAYGDYYKRYDLTVNNLVDKSSLNEKDKAGQISYYGKDEWRLNNQRVEKYNSEGNKYQYSFIEKTINFTKIKDNTGDIYNKYKEFESDGILYYYRDPEYIFTDKKITCYLCPGLDEDNIILNVMNRAEYVPVPGVDEIPLYELTFIKKVIDEDRNIVDKIDFDKINLDSNNNYYFNITLKEIERTVEKDPSYKYGLKETYGTNYTGNILTGVLQYKMNGDFKLVFSRLNPGKYEVSEKDHNYFDFDNFKLLEKDSSGNSITLTEAVSLVKENNKYYIIVSELTGNGDVYGTIEVSNIIDPLRPYDDQKDKTNLFFIN